MLSILSKVLQDRFNSREDILELLLEPSEVQWVCQQRSRSLALLSRVRKVLYRELGEGELTPTVHYMIECDVRELDKIVASCERLFSSPVPPTMSRHIVRCLLLWLVGLPLLLAGSMNRVAVALWVFVTSYIFVGIEEVGVQVEQPFEIIPMTQLCNVIMANLEEAFEPPPAE